MRTKVLVGWLIGIGGSLPVVGYALFAGGMPATEVFRPLSLFDQGMVVFTAFVAKPLYMATSLWLAWRLRGMQAADLAALRWGLLAFFVGEAFCAVNYLVFQDKSDLAEYLHNYGMVVAFGFMAYALVEGMDSRVLQYSHPRKRCAFVGLCGACVKFQEADCRLRQLFQLAIAALGVLLFIPLTAELREVSYYSSIFGTTYHYVWTHVDQLFELRYCPLAAAAAFLGALAVMQRSKDRQIPHLARMLAAAGVGATGFSLFRLFFNSAFAGNLAWAASWEELTELLLMGIVVCVLWLFRQRLGVQMGGLGEV